MSGLADRKADLGDRGAGESAYFVRTIRGGKRTQDNHGVCLDSFRAMASSARSIGFQAAPHSASCVTAGRVATCYGGCGATACSFSSGSAKQPDVRAGWT